MNKETAALSCWMKRYRLQNFCGLSTAVFCCLCCVVRHSDLLLALAWCSQQPHCEKLSKADNFTNLIEREKKMNKKVFFSWECHYNAVESTCSLEMFQEKCLVYLYEVLIKNNSIILCQTSLHCKGIHLAAHVLCVYMYAYIYIERDRYICIYAFKCSQTKL